MKNPRLERLNQEHRTAEIRLTREKHREKQQLAEAKQLTEYSGEVEHLGR